MKNTLIELAKEAGFLVMADSVSVPFFADEFTEYIDIKEKLTKFAERLRATIEQDNVEPVSEVIWLYELEVGQGIYQGCKGENAEKDIHVVANSFENSGKPFKTYLHPPKDSTEPASKDKQTPFANCQYQICDLPGQCLGEGECHHPTKVSVRALEKRIAELEAVIAAAPATPKGE